MRQKRQEKKQNSELIHWLKEKDENKENFTKSTYFQTIYFSMVRQKIFLLLPGEWKKGDKKETKQWIQSFSFIANITHWITLENYFKNSSWLWWQAILKF